MALPVLLVSLAPFGEWRRRTALMRSELEMAERGDYDSAYESLLTGYWPRFIVQHAGGEEDLGIFLWRVRVSEWTERPRGLLVTESEDPGLLTPPVVQLAKPSLPIEDFDLALSQFLGLPVRESFRLSVKLPVSASSSPGRSVRGVTVDLSAGGMLIRADHALPVGERMTWVFAGGSPLSGLAIPGAVLRPREVTGSSRSRAYPIRFDKGAQGQRDAIQRFLSEKVYGG